MRNTIILGLRVGLFGFAVAAQASDYSKSGDRERSEYTRQGATDSRGERHDERAERSRERHDEAREEQRASRDGDDDAHERNERRDRR